MLVCIGCKQKNPRAQSSLVFTMIIETWGQNREFSSSAQGVALTQLTMESSSTAARLLNPFIHLRCTWFKIIIGLELSCARQAMASTMRV